MNSDSRATAEYFDYLLGKKRIDETEDQPSVIVGGGRIGSMLLEFGQRRKYEDVLVKRGESIPADHPGPVYLCTQTTDLEEIIKATPDSKKDDLVFLGDGQLEILFQKYGLYGPTQAALWLAQMRVGGKPVDGVHPDAPEGLTQARTQHEDTEQLYVVACSAAIAWACYRAEPRPTLLTRLAGAWQMGWGACDADGHGGPHLPRGDAARRAAEHAGKARVHLGIQSGRGGSRRDHGRRGGK